MISMNALTTKRILLTVIMSVVLIFCTLSVCASETKEQDTVVRLDNDGYLYYMDYTKDYYSSDVIESRNSEISVIPTDICTNFYLGSDDIEDAYTKKGKLREEAVIMTDENMTASHNYGYGHGYHRFVTIQSQLERFRDTEKEEYYTRMPESAALVVLQSVAQNPYTNAAGVSMTQYSAIYNNKNKTVEVWPFQNYSKSFMFDVTGIQISKR